MAVGVCLAAMQAQASDNVSINPDAAGPDPTITVGSLGWNNGNAISVADTGQNLGTGIFVGQTFTTYVQQSLANFNNPGGTAIGGLNLNSTYEWTAVFGFREIVTSISGQTATFQAIAGGPNFFQVYVSGVNNNPLAGTGFNDGTPILSGTLRTGAASTSSFTNQGGSSALDQFGTDNYPGMNSVSGLGSGNLVVDVSSANSSYFLTPFTTLELDYKTFQNLPYGDIDPSAQFWNGSAFIPGATLASIGALNGSTGPNVMFETRASNNFFVTNVPEPGSLALMGLAMGAMSWVRRRKA
jgi:hypothetical protein